MAKAKTVHRDLPPRMFIRSGINKRGVEWRAYYYDKPRDPETGKRKAIPLGTDLIEAKRKWAELDMRPMSVDAKLLGHIFTRYEREETIKKAPRTQLDEAKYFKRLRKPFQNANIDRITPQHIRQYLDMRSAKVQGNREITLFSTVFNKAREWGYTNKANPCQGVKKNKEEGRDIYVSDAEFNLVYKHGSDIIKDTLEMAYLTGQRPADVRNMKWSDIREGAIWVKQGKRNAKRRIEIIGELAELIARIRSRPMGMIYVLTDPKGHQLKEFGYFRSQFDKARDAAQAEALALGIEFQRFQFRDLRPKAASDIDSLKDANKLLGHTTEKQTADYIRNRIGESVKPVKRKKVE